MAKGKGGTVRLQPVPLDRLCVCDSTDQGDGTWKHVCKVCGRTKVTRRPNIHMEHHGEKLTPADEVKMPGWMERGLRLKAAHQKWVDAGRPERSDERVAEIFDQHCKPCEFFTGSACKKCGCLVSRERTWMNKLKWATEECPLNPPKWTAEVPAND